jgi:hypothetical protein
MIGVPLARAFGRSPRLLAFSHFCRRYADQVGRTPYPVVLGRHREERSSQRTNSKPQSRYRQTRASPPPPGWGARASADLAAEMAPRRNAHRPTSLPQLRTRALLIHSIVKDSRCSGRGARPVMLDKAGGDMVPLRLNLRPAKENEAAGISIHRLL